MQPAALCLSVLLWTLSPFVRFRSLRNFPLLRSKSGEVAGRKNGRKLGWPVEISQDLQGAREVGECRMGCK